MQIENVAEQMTLLDLDTSCGKTFRAHFQAEKMQTENRSKAKTSAASSKRSPKSPKKTFAYLDLRGGGHTADASSWNTDRLLGGYTMPSISECHKDGSASVCYVTSTDLLHQGFCLTLNLSEQPRVANPSLLSEILEDEADPKYELSARACKGILTRAERRGKKLPEILHDALENQIAREDETA